VVSYSITRKSSQKRLTFGKKSRQTVPPGAFRRAPRLQHLTAKSSPLYFAALPRSGGVSLVLWRFRLIRPGRSMTAAREGLHGVPV